MSWKKAFWSVLAVCVAGVLGAGQAAAYPKPSPVSGAWHLDFSFQTPQSIAVADNQGHVHWYWYLPYKVVNNSGSDQLFVPDVVVADDLGQILHAGENVPLGVFAKIKHRLGNPLLLAPMSVVGTLKQGKDFAKESVAIWPAPKKDVEEFDVFVGGLSGETTATTDPANGKRVLLSRTLMLQFKLPGVYATPEKQPVVLESKLEVMR